MITMVFAQASSIVNHQWSPKCLCCMVVYMTYKRTKACDMVVYITYTRTEASETSGAELASKFLAARGLIAIVSLPATLSAEFMVLPIVLPAGCTYGSETAHQLVSWNTTGSSQITRTEIAIWVDTTWDLREHQHRPQFPGAMLGTHTLYTMAMWTRAIAFQFELASLLKRSRLRRLKRCHLSRKLVVPNWILKRVDFLR